MCLSNDYKNKDGFGGALKQSTGIFLNARFSDIIFHVPYWNHLHKRLPSFGYSLHTCSSSPYRRTDSSGTRVAHRRPPTRTKNFFQQISINTEILRNTTTSTSETLPVQEIPYTFV